MNILSRSLQNISFVVSQYSIFAVEKDADAVSSCCCVAAVLIIKNVHSIRNIKLRLLRNIYIYILYAYSIVTTVASEHYRA